jgi:hypothetical protein
MIKRFVLTFVVTLLAGSPFVRAQRTADEKAVLAVVNQLFKGMEKGDSSLVRGAFAKEVTMVTMRKDKENNPLLLREASLDGFLKAIGTPHPEVWYEEIWNINTQIDDDFAQVWCDYAFYAGNTFSHCGVDAFQLHRGKEGWKIFHLADTRRNKGCVIPEEIQRKHK